MNKKVLGVFVSLLVVAMLATPLAVAKPGEEKSNEKFQPFELRLIGYVDAETGEEWQTPPEPAEPKTTHVRDRVWVTTDLTLTVGAEVYTFTSDPVYVTYYGTMDIDTNLQGDDGVRVNHFRVTETITFYNEEDEVIGTLEIDVRDMAKPPEGASGTFVAHGTGALEGVMATGTDSVEFPPLTIVRTGTVMDWPTP